MDMDRARCCCFTGHRPDKLHLPEAEFKAMLGREIDAAIADGYEAFISGMACGIDVYAAEEVIARLERGVRLICAYPYPDSCERFTPDWRARCREIARHAADQVCVSERYHAGCFMQRNSWMIEHSSRLIAVFDGTRGGTYGTLVRAAAQRLDVRVLMLER